MSERLICETGEQFHTFLELSIIFSTLFLNRIVCDDWIEIQCTSWECQDILLKALRIRQIWSQFLTNLFNGKYAAL